MCNSHSVKVSAVNSCLKVLVIEAVPKPGCVCVLVDLSLFSKGRTEWSKCARLTEVLHDAACLCKAVCGVNVQHCWRLSAYDPHRCFTILCCAIFLLCFVAEPRWCILCDCRLYSTPIKALPECGCWRKSHTLTLPPLCPVTKPNPTHCILSRSQI